MSSEPKKSLSILITHFGDPRWIKLLINRILETTSDEVLEIYVINQDRTRKSLVDIINMSPSISIINPPSWELDRVSSSLSASFDHGSSLNYAILNIPFRGDFILILDNDCFPMSPSWMNSVQQLLHKNSAILAEAPKTYYLTHPCLMLIPKSATRSIDFLQGMVELGFDTGRLIGLQLSFMNIQPRVQLSSKEIGRIGFTYMNRTFIHLVATSYTQWRKEEFGDLIRFQNIKLDFKYFLIQKWYELGFTPLNQLTLMRYVIVFLFRKTLLYISQTIVGKFTNSRK